MDALRRTTVMNLDEYVQLNAYDPRGAAESAQTRSGTRRSQTTPPSPTRSARSAVPSPTAATTSMPLRTRWWSNEVLPVQHAAISTLSMILTESDVHGPLWRC